MTINSINSSGYNFGNLASIKKQAQAVADRVEAQSKARKAEQEATGLMKNAKGELVEISSIPEWERDVLEQRAIQDSVSPQEALLAALATAPNNEDVERSKALSAKFIPIQNKMLAGKPLTAAEKNFMQKNYPEWAAIAQRVEHEVQQLREQIKKSSSSEDSKRIIIEKKMQLMSGIGKKDGSILFLMPAIDRAFSQYIEQEPSAGSKTDIWA